MLSASLNKTFSFLSLRSVSIVGGGETESRRTPTDVADGQRPVPRVAATHDDGHATHRVRADR